MWNICFVCGSFKSLVFKISTFKWKQLDRRSVTEFEIHFKKISEKTKYCVSFRGTTTWFSMHIQVSILFQILPSFTVFLNTEQSSLCCMVGPQWLLILNIADPLAMYCISRMYKIIAFPSL